jgi:hypothetical protein
MRELILTVLLVVAVSCTSARSPGLLLVRVVDERCGLPLPDTTVTVTSGSKTLSKKTDVHGSAEFSVEPGRWQIEPALPGSFGAQVESVNVTAATETRVDVWLNLVRPGSIVMEFHGPCRPRTATTPN